MVCCGSFVSHLKKKVDLGLVGETAHDSVRIWLILNFAGSEFLVQL